MYMYMNIYTCTYMYMHIYIYMQTFVNAINLFDSTIIYILKKLIKMK